MVRLKRIYEKPEKSDGLRILVDRLWPRGISKEKATIDLWLKEIAPSDALRKWFAHDPEKWEQFRKKYKVELKQRKELLYKIRELENEKRDITLLYSAKDEKHNNAIILKELLKK